MEKKYTFQEAYGVALEVVAILTPGCVKISIAGSLRREKKFVHDIDIVAFPIMSEVRNQMTLFDMGAGIVKMPIALNSILHERFQTGCVECNDKYMRSRQLIYKGIPVDLFMTEPEGDNWGPLLQMRTGSEQFNVRMAQRAQKLGAKYHAGHGIIVNGERIDNGTEEGVFGSLGLKYVDPKFRD